MTIYFTYRKERYGWRGVLQCLGFNGKPIWSHRVGLPVTCAADAWDLAKREAEYFAMQNVPRPEIIARKPRPADDRSDFGSVQPGAGDAA